MMDIYAMGFYKKRWLGIFNKALEAHSIISRETFEKLKACWETNAKGEWKP